MFSPVDKDDNIVLKSDVCGILHHMQGISALNIQGISPLNKSEKFTDGKNVL
jgi:hypothetical protein